MLRDRRIPQTPIPDLRTSKPGEAAPLVPASAETETQEEANRLRTERRSAQAGKYFADHLEGQRKWYSDKASKYKSWSQALSLIVLTAGAATTIVQVFRSGSEADLIAIITALLGAVVIIAKGMERIGQYEESWLNYRRASEQMQREYRLFINGAGSYRLMPDDDSAYRWFVESVEQVIAEEQKIFWSDRSDAGRLVGPPADTGQQKAVGE